MEPLLTSKRSKLDLFLYTLCLEGTAVAICAFERGALEKDVEGTIRDAFFETWRFGGGDIKQLVDRKIMARPATEEEGDLWEEGARAFGKPYLVLAGGGEARGTA
jgi:hypothetical protein